MSAQGVVIRSGVDLCSGIEEKQIIGKWSSGCYKITLFISKIQKNKIKAFVDNPIGPAYLSPSQVKCGALGLIPHEIFIQRIHQCAQNKLEETFNAIHYSNGQESEVWFFEISPPPENRSADFLFYRQHLEAAETKDTYNLLLHFEKVIAIQKQIGNKTDTLESVILSYK